jgi:hypothetical protein
MWGTKVTKSNHTLLQSQSVQTPTKLGMGVVWGCIYLGKAAPRRLLMFAWALTSFVEERFKNLSELSVSCTSILKALLFKKKKTKMLCTALRCSLCSHSNVKDGMVTLTPSSFRGYSYRVINAFDGTWYSVLGGQVQGKAIAQVQLGYSSFSYFSIQYRSSSRSSRIYEFQV